MTCVTEGHLAGGLCYLGLWVSGCRTVCGLECARLYLDDGLTGDIVMRRYTGWRQCLRWRESEIYRLRRIGVANDVGYVTLLRAEVVECTYTQVSTNHLPNAQASNEVSYL